MAVQSSRRDATYAPDEVAIRALCLRLWDAWNARDGDGFAAVFAEDGEWRIASFQNTPAQLHGRPELVQQLTEELRQLL